MPATPFPALIVDRQANGSQSPAALTALDDPAALPNAAGDLLVRVTHSSLNYKDALAVTGRGRVLRRFPIVPGIDLAGVVETPDEQGGYSKGDPVLVTGWGLGEQFSGGYAGYAHVRPDWVIPLPRGLTAQHCMAIGTAGFTAMLSILALEDHGVRPDAGPVLVTGAAGGVGSLAILMLAGHGYEVVASSGRIEEQGDYLRDLGASALIHRDELSAAGGRPLEAERWAGAIDSVGGQTLAGILRQTRYRGSVAACGLAGGTDLAATVLPFILRGVNLLGIDSVMCPRPLRERAWQRLAETIDLKRLEQLADSIPLQQVPASSVEILAGRVRGRTVVDMNL